MTERIPNNIIKKENNDEIKISSEKKEMANELIAFGANTGNNLKFFDYGKEYVTNIFLKEEVVSGLTEEEIKDLDMYLKILKSYVSGPIFTDDFHKDHASRKIWENRNPENINALKPKTKNYYLANRLNQGSRVHPAMGFFSEIIEKITNKSKKEKLLDLKKEIPKEFTSKEDLYSLLSDEEKINVVNKFSEVIEKAIDLLENKIFNS